MTAPDPFQQPPVQQPQIPKTTPPNVVTITIIGIGFIILAGLLVAIRVMSQTFGARGDSFGLTVLTDGTLADSAEIFRLQLASFQLFLSCAAIAIVATIVLFHEDSNLRRTLRIVLSAMLTATPLLTTLLSPRWGGAITVLAAIPIAIAISMLWFPNQSKQWFALTPQQPWNPTQPQGHMPGQTVFYPRDVDRPASRSGPTFDQPPSPPSIPNSE